MDPLKRKLEDFLKLFVLFLIMWVLGVIIPYNIDSYLVPHNMKVGHGFEFACSLILEVRTKFRKIKKKIVVKRKFYVVVAQCQEGHA